jgi:O-antigen ligase
MSLRFINQNPLAGVGPGIFNQKMVEQLDWNEVKATYKTKGITDRNVSIDPHNTYLGWAAEAGIPFVIIMLGLFLGLYRLLWKGYKAWPDSFTGGFCYVCLCGMAGFLVNGLYTDILTMRHFWIMMGLGTLGSVLCLRSQTIGVKAQ